MKIVSCRICLHQDSQAAHGKASHLENWPSLIHSLWFLFASPPFVQDGLAEVGQSSVGERAVVAFVVLLHLGFFCSGLESNTAPQEVGTLFSLVQTLVFW